MRLQVENKKLLIAVIMLGILLVSLLSAKSMIDKHRQPTRIRPATTDANISIAGNIGAMDTIERTAAKFKTVEEAEKVLPYKPLVPANTNGRVLIGIYVEDNSTLYLKYAGGLYIIYHSIPAGFNPSFEEPLRNRPDLFEVKVRGHRGIAKGPITAGTSKTSANEAQLVWYGDGLDILMTCDRDSSVNELLKIAESMH